VGFSQFIAESEHEILRDMELCGDGVGLILNWIDPGGDNSSDSYCGDIVIYNI